MTSLLPVFGSTLYVVVAFVISLSIIVAIHEYGHYIVGRWSGIKAEVFSLGFGPVLVSRVDRHGTRWQIAALPFGGYVRFKGDEDAASATQDSAAIRNMSAAERRQTMQGAPLWARAATVAAGPVFNFILSTVLFAALLFARGDVAEPIAVGSLRALPPVQGSTQSGLEPGDQILSIGGVSLQDDQSTASMPATSLPRSALVDYVVRRDGQQITVPGPYPYPPLVAQLSPNSAAYDAGLKQGDVITAIGDTPVVAFDQLREAVEGSNGAPQALTVWRPGTGSDLHFTLVPRRVDEPAADGGFTTQWRIGIAGGMAFELATERAGLWQSITGGVTQTWSVIVTSLDGLWNIATGAISSCNMTGPIGIAKTSGAMASQGLVSFVWFVAALSTGVGLLNLFPVPVLDGGHLVFHAWEAVTGRPPSDRALRVLMIAGMTLVLAVMLFALTNDVTCP
ncbi:RIP metalloprotease RseP [Pseudooceanicola sp. CBS1P-1]|uniref:Zinc metalloprotease n=1 Tax=Pseudooceanicola albus TaxID=2692189 RepID=A0A6L7FZG8_9RHOB|nr:MULTISPECIES: RIP metalloprotease RseP [Pseudooceanicola]MBT9383180.1 RIP metalloprotease RseP [Pseudooceanicola endophyticus]MXN16497.1 RIP metalloprotease RseP [Pseudooceanicola albus]